MTQSFTQQTNDGTKGFLLRKILLLFAAMWTLSGVGLVLGQFVPVKFLIPLIVVEFLMIVAMVFLRKAKKVSSLFALIFAFISGLTIYPAINYYIGELGGQIVLLVFLTTAVTFAVYGMIGYGTKKNLSGWGKYLFISLLALVVFWIVGFFVQLGSGLVLLLSFAGVIIFSLYTIYDFNRISKGSLDERDVPLMAVNLYLDFINLFLSVLRIVNHFKD